jgi:hypothetical protein
MTTMRKLYLFLTICLSTSSISFGQVECGGIAIPENWDFENEPTPTDYILEIDTISNVNNIWQIGIPQKSLINTAYSSPNVIITDTMNPYPTNDTSVFIFKHIDQGGYSTPHSAELAGNYFVNSDSLNDYGTIEISLDQGTTWINLLTDTIYSSYYYWNTPKPTLTGNSNGWQNFWVSLAPLGYPFNVNWSDTILLKFSFISDSIADGLDGLAYDSFNFCDGVEGIDELLNDDLISVYPNPTSNLLYINRRNQSTKESIKIYGYNGQLLYQDNNFNSKSIDLNKLNLTDGLYFIYYSDTQSYSVKKIIIRH